MRLLIANLVTSVQTGFSFLLVCLYFLCTFSSCSDDEATAEIIPSADSEIFFKESLDFSSGGEEKTIKFTTNKDWSIEVSQSGGDVSWCSVSPTRGKAGENIVRVKTSPNTGYDDRNVILTITAKKLTKKVVITQKQKDALTVTTTKYEVGKNGGTIQVEVKANMNYEVLIPKEYQSWIHKSPTSRALSTSLLNFSIDRSEEYNKREGQIIIQGEGHSETLDVFQAGEGILILSKNEYIVSYKGEQIKVELSSNFEYEVKMPQVDWITATTSRGVSSHTLYYTIAPNNTYDSREAEIIFYDRKNSVVKETLKVQQTQKDIIILPQKEYTVSAKKCNINVAIQSNVKYDILINNDWIKSVTSKSISEEMMTFSILENTGFSDRVGTIAFTYLNITEKVIIRQPAGSVPFITVECNSYEIDSEGREFDIVLNCNVDYTISTSSEWVQLNNLHCKILANEGKERKAIILIENIEHNISLVINITQKASKDPDGTINDMNKEEW